jgi:glycine/sarcosine N-methyltransferase
MTDPIAEFYDALAEDYHLIFEDWDRSIEYQRGVLTGLVRDRLPDARRILDCACGIGTQALGFSRSGFRTVGSDLSRRAIGRAAREAARRELPASFFVSDMRALPVADGAFDAVVALDNALPHLPSAADHRAAVASMGVACRAGGMVMVSVRDYGAALVEKPTAEPPRVWGEPGDRRVVLPIWTWLDDRTYELVHVTGREAAGAWRFATRTARYRAVRVEEVADAFREAGLTAVETLAPSESGYYQPLILGFRRHADEEATAAVRGTRA